MRQYSFILLVILFFLSGCASYKWEYDPVNHTKDDIEKLFVMHKGRWWNYYERGLALMRGCYWESARRDFEKAISMLSNDQRYAITYGVNRIDYFANMELGIALYKIGQNKEDANMYDEAKELYEEAEKHLKISLNTVKSPTTVFYLKEILKKSEEIKSSPKPSIKILWPKDGDIIKDDIITIHAEVNDRCFIDSIYLNGKQIFVEYDKKRFEFEKNIRIKDGDNQITVEATNLNGKRERKTIVVKSYKNEYGVFPSREFPSRELSLEKIFRKRTNFRFNRKSNPIKLASNDDKMYLRQLCVNTNSTLEQGEQDKQDNRCKIIPEDVLKPRYRYRIIVLPFANMAGLEVKLSNGNYIRNEVFYQLEESFKDDEDKRFNLRDYDEKIFFDEEKKKELKLGNRDLLDIKKIKEVLKKRGIKEVDGIIIGEMRKNDKNEHGIEIRASLYDYEEINKGERDGFICGAIKVIKDKGRGQALIGNIKTLASLLQEEVESKMAIQHCIVSDVEWPDNFFGGDLQKGVNMQPNMKLVLFRCKGRNFIPPLLSSDIVTEGKIIDADKDNIIAKVIKKGKEIKKGDIIITK